MRREILLRHGITGAIAGSAGTLEWRRIRDPGIYPGMEAKERKPLVAGIGRHNTEAKRLAGIWAELRNFLNSDAETSGRLTLRHDGKDEVRVLERRSLETVEASWLAPALVIDATLPDAKLIEPVIGHPVEVRADIAARWSEHVRVRQVLGAPVSDNKLGIVEGKRPEAPRRAVHHLLRLIRLRAALAFPRIVVVIAPKQLIALLNGLGLPPNAEAGHFGAVAGIDRWREAAGLICIGRRLPGPLGTGIMAGAVTGRVPQTLPPNEHGVTWYPKVEGGVRLASGEGVRVEIERHPDPIVEALRWQVTEAGLVQAIGRLRPLRRTAATPAFVDIVSDVPLPISVDEVVPWSEALPGAWAEMAPAGVLLEKAADIMRAFPDLAPTRRAAREHTVAAVALTSIRYFSIGVGASLATVCRYKRRGHEPASCYLLPNRPADLQGWMAERLKGLEWLKVDGDGQRPVAGSPDADGVALDSPVDMAAAWPERWATMAAARDWRSRNGGITLSGVLVRFRYQRQGRNQKWRCGAYDPTIVADAAAWLAERLGPLAGFERVESTAEPPSPAAAGALRSSWPFAAAADIDPDLVAAYRCVVDIAPDPTPPAPVKAEIVRFDPNAPIRFPPVIAAKLARIRAGEEAAARRSVETRNGDPRFDREPEEARA